MGQVADGMTAKLRAAFDPEQLNVIDETNQHHGPAGWKESGETHFKVEITAAAFAGKSRVQRHQLVYGALGERMREEIHALSMKTLTPEEAGAEGGNG